MTYLYIVQLLGYGVVPNHAPGNYTSQTGSQEDQENLGQFYNKATDTGLIQKMPIVLNIEILA